ncbi:hypothetical protein [Henriciella sp.]|nr:hypothetical protein [Henriciella sp.]
MIDLRATPRRKLIPFILNRVKPYRMTPDENLRDLMAGARKQARERRSA